MTLFINKTTENIIKSTVKKQPQALLLIGPDGVGLGTIAKHIAQLNKVTPIVYLPEKDEQINLESGVISVDIMRRLYDQTKTKSIGQRIFIIDFAERMTVQAQNAFLKLLEEPGENVYFILLSHSASKLLPTIVSRSQVTDIKPISDDQSKTLLKEIGVNDPKKTSQLLFMANGLPAELIRLASDDKYFEKRSETVRDAREFLQGKTYQKLLIAHRYKDNRPEALRMLLDSANILKISTLSNPQPDGIKLIDRILSVYERIESNGNIRLQLARLCL